MVAQFHNPTHWCILTRDDGVLEIRALPSWNIHYFCKNFAMSPKVGRTNNNLTQRHGAAPLDVANVTLCGPEQ